MKIWFSLTRIKNGSGPRAWRNAMRRYLYGCTAVLVCVLSVAAAKSDRYVKDNMFSSSSPRLQVKVDPQFKYLGKLDYTVEQQSPDRLQLVSYETRSYIFVNTAVNQLKKAVYIQLRREQTKYVGNLLGDAKENVRSGICSLGQKEYNCFTRIIFLSADEPVAGFISEKGYSLPVCVLARTYARADVSAGNYLVVITYLENMSGSDPGCESWQAGQPLTGEQKRFLDQFDRNREASFKVVEKSLERPGIKGLIEGEGLISPRRDLP
jgi:hypothetical protein